jgi:carboxyl-terminal processing protease
LRWNTCGENAQIILDEVEIKSVVFFSKIDAKTGYIVLAHFNKKASYETKQALEELKRQGAERILDLRGNPEACSMKR